MIAFPEECRDAHSQGGGTVGRCGGASMACEEVQGRWVGVPAGAWGAPPPMGAKNYVYPWKGYVRVQGDSCLLIRPVN